MRLEPPAWWYGKGRVAPLVLAPLGRLYGAAVQTRFAFAKPYRPRLPVICIGNFTLGGAGKTPAAIAIAALLREMGLKPAFLTRGYGGSLAGPHWVDARRDAVLAVGDEPLLLARHASTVVARDRPAGARLIEASQADVIVMDDGFQNPSLAKDLSLIAVDGGAGLGNGAVFPAGPLRAPLAFQLARADAILLIGDGSNRTAQQVCQASQCPVIAAAIRPKGDTAWLRGAPVIAFSGIGRPQKFFDTLAAAGAEIVAAAGFPDHYVFKPHDALRLLAQAGQAAARLVTTEKDWVRIGADAPPLSELRARAQALAVELSIPPAGQDVLKSLLRGLNGSPAE